MSIGSTLNNQGILLLAAIVGLIVVPLLFYLLSTVLGLIERVLGIKSSIPGLVLLLAIPGALLVVSLLLDRVGEVRPGQVFDKKENVVVHADGSWDDNMSVSLRYSVAGEPLPPFTSTGAALVDAMATSSTQELATMKLTAADFDRLYLGASVDLKVLRVRDLFSLVRLASWSTGALVPWDILEAALGVVALVFLAWQLRKMPLGYVPLAALALVALVVPAAVAYRTWQDRENLVGKTEHATATVGDVAHVTKIILGQGSSDLDTISAPQPFDIVQFEFVPPGHHDPIVGVDAVDVDPRGASQLVQGSPIDVVYAPGEPRDARVTGQTRTHYLKTTLGFYQEYAGLVLLVGVVVVFAGYIIQGRKRRSDSRTMSGGT